MISYYIVVYLVAVALGASIVVLFLKEKLWKKVSLIVLLFFIATSAFLTLNNLLGYPTKDKPDAGRIVWVEIVERVGIFAWIYEERERDNLLEILTQEDTKELPRSVYYEYNEQNKQLFERIRGALLDGKIIMIEKKKSVPYNTPDESELKIIEPRTILKKDY